MSTEKKWTLRPRTVVLTLISILLLLLLAAGSAFVFSIAHFMVFGQTNTVAESSSPDGMYHVIIKETKTSGQSRTDLALYRRKGAFGSFQDQWSTLDSATINNDSSTRSNYSIVWALDEHNAPTSVRIFGDFGSAPFAGTQLFAHGLPVTPKPP